LGNFRRLNKSPWEVELLPAKNGVVSNGEGKLARKATGYEGEKAEAALSRIGVRWLRNPSFRRSLERIGDTTDFSDEAKRKGVSAEDTGKQLSAEFQAKYPDWPNMNLAGFVRSVYAE
jgi:hypothetical protein